MHRGNLGKLVPDTTIITTVHRWITLKDIKCSSGIFPDISLCKHKME